MAPNKPIEPTPGKTRRRFAVAPVAGAAHGQRSARAMTKRYAITFLVPIVLVVGLWFVRSHSDEFRKYKELMVFLGSVTPQQMCGIDVVSEYPSPDGNKKAVLYQFDCGATTPFTSNVSILEMGGRVQYEPGNVFSAHHGSRTGDWGGPITEVRWTGDSAVEISYIGDATVTRQEGRHGTFKVTYANIAR